MKQRSELVLACLIGINDKKIKKLFTNMSFQIRKSCFIKIFISFSFDFVNFVEFFEKPQRRIALIDFSGVCICSKVKKSMLISSVYEIGKKNPW